MSIKSLLKPFVFLLAIVPSIIAQQSDRPQSFERGLQLYAQGQYDRAIAEFRESLSQFGPYYAQSLYNIGVCNYELGRKSESIGWYREAIRFKANYVAAFHALGVALDDLSETAQSREAFTRAVELSREKHAPSLFRLGLALQREGDLEAAAVSYKKAIRESGDRMPGCHNNLGVIEAMLGDLNAAERHFETAIRQSKGNFESAKYNLSLCREMIATSTRSLLASLRVASSDLSM